MLARPGKSESAPPPAPLPFLTVVVRLTLWHRLQPIWLNSDCPLSSDAVLVVGVGGANNCMKLAKLTTSADISDVVPCGVLKKGLGMVCPLTIVFTCPLMTLTVS